MPYFCRSDTCGLTHVHKLTNFGGGAGEESDEEEAAQGGCGRYLEGQVRFDSAQFGAALDIVFTGSVEHLEDQVCMGHWSFCPYFADPPSVFLLSAPVFKGEKDAAN
eukprot:SAG22_NODE_907_length_6555_cov_19.560099_5_plen_107_part_00